MIDITRHQEVFDAIEYNKKVPQTHIIGCGAVGSRVAFGAAKLGISNLVLWDFDRIESHNVANQIYGLQHVGMLKVEALYSMIREFTKEKPLTKGKMDGEEALTGVIFLMVDQYNERRKIWNKNIKLNSSIQLMIDVRMGVDLGRVYTIQPFDISQGDYWLATLGDDNIVTETSCGSKLSVGPTAELISSLALWQLMKWFHLIKKGEYIKNNQVLFSTTNKIDDSFFIACNSFSRRI